MVLQYLIAGLALGGIYAIASAGLVVTYESSGILNFAFGSIAFFVARFYYFLHTQHSWGILPAAAVALLVAGPAIGILLYFALFRFLRLSSPLIKVVATLGLSVAIPSVAILIFGNQAIQAAPGLAPEPVHVYRFLGTPVTLDQIIVYACVVVVVVAGGAILRYTDAGLKVRAMVDSPSMTALSGTNPNTVSIAVWGVSTFFAGVVGVLAAPIIGLDSANFILLVAAALAAVVAARLKSLPIAVVVGLAMGVVTSLVQGYLPPSSSWTTEIVNAIPFAFIAVFLVYSLVRGGSVAELGRVGGPVDAAITPQGESRLAGASLSALDQGTLGAVTRYGPPAFLLVVAAILPALLGGFWVGLTAQAFAYGIFFLSYTLVTGEGGMIWLCQITFAGIGAMTAAQLATVYGWPVLAAVLVGGLVALPIGLIVGLLTIRLGDLYVALVTLTFGLLVEQLVFTLPRFQNFGQGVNMGRPDFAQSDTAIAYLCLVGFLLVSVFVWNLRQSSTGLALNAVRWSEPGSRTLGVNVVWMKVLVSGIGALVAGIGGGLLVVAQGTAQPASFSTFEGVFWLAVLVTIGVRSNSAALLAGFALALIPAVLQSYAPLWTVQLPPLLFGLGAIGVARAPDGSLAELEHAVRRFVTRRLSPPSAEPVIAIQPAEPTTQVVGS